MFRGKNKKSGWPQLGFKNQKNYLRSIDRPEMINSIETTIAIAFFGPIAIAIAIGKAIFLLFDKLLLLLTGSLNYCFCYWFY